MYTNMYLAISDYPFISNLKIVKSPLQNDPDPDHHQNLIDWSLVQQQRFHNISSKPIHTCWIIPGDTHTDNTDIQTYRQTY